jgi:Ca2+-binding RTX toxin-like protein
MTDTTTLLSNGVSSTRVDIAFISEGYTQEERGLFLQDASTMLSYMTSITNRTLNDPFYSYRSMLNASATFVASQQSGYDINGVAVNTAFDAAAYLSDNRLVYGDSNKVEAAVSHLTAAQAADIVIVIVNSSNYGGAGGSVAWTTARNPSSYEIALHEIGHSFADLHDEYVDASIASLYPLSAIADSVHVSASNNPALVNWSEWVGYTDSLGTVGVYEGGYYRSTGVWRATPDSKMLTLGVAFSAPEKEAFINRFYTIVGDFLNVSSANWLNYAAATPDNGLFSFAWSVNGQQIQGGASPLFSLNSYLRTQADGERSYNVSVAVTDATGNIRESAVATNATEVESRTITATKITLDNSSNVSSFSSNKNYFIIAAAGDDAISLALNGAFNSYVDGGTGGDALTGGAGGDTLDGGSDNDMLAGGAGADSLIGGDGFDYARYDDTAHGDITVSMNSAANAVLGTSAAQGDSFDGIEGLILGSGNDWVYGDGGANYLYGQGGNDNLFGSIGADYLHGGAGFDYARYDDASYGDIVVSMNNPANLALGTGPANDDQFFEIEGLIMGGGNDWVCGDGNANYLYGQGGNDNLFGSLGADYLHGGAGLDYARFDDAGYGALVADLAGANTNTGAAAGDIFVEVEGLILTGNADMGFGTDGFNYLYGLGGNDTLSGRGGDDYLDGGTGNDQLTGGTGLDIFQHRGVGYGTDTVTDFVGGTGASDRVNLQGMGFANFAAVLAASVQVGANLEIRSNATDKLVLLNFSISNFAADDVVL